MARNVNVKLPDGSIQLVTDVPDQYTDEQVGKRYGGTPISTGEDVVRAAGSGVPYGISRGLTAIPKAVAGMGTFAGIAPPEWLRSAVSKVDETGDQLGGGYVPSSKPGEYAKSMVSSAIPMPGMGPPGTQMALGALSGAAAQGTSDLGLGPMWQTIAAMTPYAGAAGISALSSRHPVYRTREALAAMSAPESVTMHENLRLAKENDLPLMAWQAAPEGSELRSLGKAVAGAPQSYRMRRGIGDQAYMMGDPNQLPPSPQLPSKVSGPMYEASGKAPISTPQLEQVYKSVEGVKQRLNLPEGSAGAKQVDRVLKELGTYQPASIRDLAPNDRMTAADYQQFINNPPVTFKPNIKSFAELQSTYKDVPLPEGMQGVDANTKVKLEIRNAIAEVADSINPAFAMARGKHSDLKILEKAVEDTNVRGRAGGLDTAAGARTEAFPEMLYAGATTPMWAMVPAVRELAQRQMMRKYNNVFSSVNPSDYAALAAERPLTNAIKYSALGLLSPFRQGQFDKKD